MAVPTMPDSASGVSMTRPSPKSFCSPSVIRKTPPSFPMSSPINTTLGSVSRALRRAALRALAMVMVAISVPLLERHQIRGELAALLVDARVPVAVDVLEDRDGVGVRQGA